MSKSKRLKPETFATRAEFDAAVDRITTIDTETRRLAAVRDAILERCKARYNARIKSLAAESELALTRCALYAQENRGVLLPDETKAKSGTTLFSTWGFRLGNPKLNPLKGWTWERVLGALKSSGLLDYIRTKEETDKERVLSDAKKHGHLLIHDDTAGGEITVALKDVGLEVDQGEAFYVDPKQQEAAK